MCISCCQNIIFFRQKNVLQNFADLFVKNYAKHKIMKELKLQQLVFRVILISPIYCNWRISTRQITTWTWENCLNYKTKANERAVLARKENKHKTQFCFLPFRGKIFPEKSVCFWSYLDSDQIKDVQSSKSCNFSLFICSNYWNCYQWSLFYIEWELRNWLYTERKLISQKNLEALNTLNDDLQSMIIIQLRNKTLSAFIAFSYSLYSSYRF